MTIGALKVKKNEIYRDIKTVPPIIIRADGRNFKESLKRLNFEKPYDISFERGMVTAARRLILESGLSPEWVFTFSDEFNILFKELPFEGRLEKLDSVVPSFLSSALTIALKIDTPLAFDARVIPMHPENMIEYLQYRQAEAWRNHMQSYGFYSLVKEGVNEKDAAAKMHGMKYEDIHEMMWRRGVNLGETPGWQRKGVLVYKKKVEKEGYDPVKKEKVIAIRTELDELWDPPIFNSKEGIDFLKEII
nr:tRNA(His) guanylyltransferase Thg1 family protein [Methanocella sp. CWC-04]